MALPGPPRHPTLVGRVAALESIGAGRLIGVDSGVQRPYGPWTQGLNDDRQLVDRMLAGDERAFAAFFDEYFPRVYRFALPRVNRDLDLAKDVVQATLIKAVRGLGGFRGDAALFTWMCQICRREIRTSCAGCAATRNRSC